MTENITPEQWLQDNETAIEKRYQELLIEYPNATILKPGFHDTLLGYPVFNTQFVISQ